MKWDQNKFSIALPAESLMCRKHLWRRVCHKQQKIFPFYFKYIEVFVCVYFRVILLGMKLCPVNVVCRGNYMNTSFKINFEQ